MRQTPWRNELASQLMIGFSPKRGGYLVHEIKDGIVASILYQGYYRTECRPPRREKMPE